MKLLGPAAALVAIVIIVLGLSLNGTPSVSGQDTSGGPGAANTVANYELVAPLGSVMTVMEDVFNRFPEKLKSGTPRDYKALRREALFVAEMGNLYGRLKEHASKKDWAEFCGQLKGCGVAMSEAATKSDGDAFKKAFDKAKDACGKCHDKYRD